VSEARTVVKVRIGGDEYTLRSDRPADYTQAVADHVDRTLKDVQSAGSAGVESHKAAILAALAITDELFQARAARAELTSQLLELAGSLARVLPPAKRGSRGSVAMGGDEA
jgi:cell division protein ZapA